MVVQFFCNFMHEAEMSQILTWEKVCEMSLVHLLKWKQTLAIPDCYLKFDERMELKSLT